jgi:hypothetical protein
VAVEKQQGIERAVLGGGGDLVVDRQMRAKGANLGRTHVLRVAFVMEHDKAFYPTEVGFFRAVTEVFQADDIAHVIEQFAFGFDGTIRGVLCHGISSHSRVFSGLLFACMPNPVRHITGRIFTPTTRRLWAFIALTLLS